MRDSVAKRGAAGSTFEHVAARGGRQPRPPALLLRDQGAAAGRGRPPRRRDPRRPARRAAGQGEDRRRRPRRPRRQPHRPDRERTGLLPAPLRAVQRRPAQPRHPPRGRPALRAHPLPRRRGPRGARSGRGCSSLRYDAEAIVSYLFAVGDGFALQALSDPERDNGAALAAGAASAATCSAASSPSLRCSFAADAWAKEHGRVGFTDHGRRCERLANQPMREPMIQLAGFLGRHRRWVVLGWVAIVVLALPLAPRQTDHLTGGGFDVPGSQSKAVTDSLQQRLRQAGRRDRRAAARHSRRHAGRRGRGVRPGPP